MNLALSIAALLAALTTTCLAQHVHIGFPPNNSFVSPGSNLLVQVVQNVSLLLDGLPNRTDIDFIGHFPIYALHSARCCDWDILMLQNKFSLPFSRPSIGNHSLQGTLRPAIPTIAFHRASSAKFHGHYSHDDQARPCRAFRLPYCFDWGKWFW